MNALKRFWNDERGVAAIEYAIIAAVIAVGLMSNVNSDLNGAGYN